MTVPEIITFVRKQTWASSTNVTDAQILSYLNIAYHKMENIIVDLVDEDYFWDTHITDTVAWQNEYVLRNSTRLQQWVKKISRIEIKKTTEDAEYTNVLQWTLADQNIAEWSISTNFYEYRDWSIFVYPKPTESITDWLKIYIIADLIDLVVDGTEDKIFPRQSSLRQYHYIIWLGAIPFVERQRDIKDKNNYTTSMQIFNAEVQDMVVQLNSKNNEPAIWILPNSEIFY